MAMSSSAIFDAICPQYASHDSKATFMAMAEERTSPTAYGTKRNYAVAYRAAHEMTIALAVEFAGGATGEVASKKEGDLQISYFKASTGGSAVSASDAELGMTTYGKKLMALGKGNILSFGVTGTTLL